MNKPQIKIVFADDHLLIREGTRTLLASDASLWLVGEAIDGFALISLVEEYRPDIVLTDIRMPNMDGLEAAHIIAERFPGTGLIASCMHNGEYHFLKMLEAGFHGILLKSATREEHFEAIKTVYKGGHFFCRDALPAITALIKKKLFRPGSSYIKDPLTSREKEILILICRGYSSRQIGEELGISMRTVETYRQKLFSKTERSNLAGLIEYAFKEGIIR